MWSFRKKDELETSTEEPTSTQQNMWLVWLLSIATFVLTVLIVLGLFWGGRWVVHQFTKKSTTTTQKAPAVSNDRKTADKVPNNNSGNPTNNPQSAGQNTPKPTPAPVPPTPAPQPTPIPQPAPTNLVNTGPTSDE